MLPEQILSPSDVTAMASVAENLRDRTFVLTLYESGCRIGELLPLKIKHVEFDSYGAVLLVNGKTGMRRVRIIASAPSLAAWLEMHPLRQKQDAPLWIVIGNKNRYTQLSYGSACTVLRKLARKAGIRKRVNPHAFRHARATHLASVLTEAQLKELFGWVQSSDMPATYVHLSGRDVDNALLRLYGFAVKKQDEQNIELRVCPRCSEPNDPASKFCKRCGAPLSIKEALELGNNARLKDELVTAVIKRLVEKLNIEKAVYETIKELGFEHHFENL